MKIINADARRLWDEIKFWKKYANNIGDDKVLQNIRKINVYYFLSRSNRNERLQGVSY